MHVGQTQLRLCMEVAGLDCHASATVDSLAVQTVPNRLVSQASETPNHPELPGTVFHIRVAVLEPSLQNLDLIWP